MRDLTPREQEIYDLVCDGCSNSRISEIFNISIGYQVKDSYQFRMILQLNRLTERKIMFNIAKENRCSTFL